MRQEELANLSRYWTAALAEHRLVMSPASIFLVEKTIRALAELEIAQHTIHELAMTEAAGPGQERPNEN